MTSLWADDPYIKFYTEPPIRFKFEIETTLRSLVGAQAVEASV